MDSRNNIELIHGSIVGFDGRGCWFRTLKGKKSMSLLHRARQDGCGQPCIMEVEYVETDNCGKHGQKPGESER